jgi:hypothetical protein
MKSDNAHSLLFPAPTVGAYCNGVPVFSYGYTHIYGESPDLLEDTRIQAHNDKPLRKIPLKKSSEIGFNLVGGTTPRMPRTPANDYLPLEPIHLIDGDVSTCWSSRPAPQPDVEPVWVRIDLPAEKRISSVVLRKRGPGPARGVVGSMPLDPGALEVGMAIPNHLSVRLSQDGLRWESVFEGQSADTPENTEFRCDFEPRQAKQIWILGSQLKRVENWHFSFSIASAEILDEAGRNLALASLGAGVTVNSTQHSFGQTREEHHRLWPIFSDLGLKWIRIGYHDDPINWHWVEKEAGKLEIDPEADAAVTHAVENGIDIILSLGFGNRLYSQERPSRQLPQLWEWYYENPPPPTTPKALQGWANYVRFMCRHFKDRVKVFEVWNEWNVDLYWGRTASLQDYLAVARTAIPIIREECPTAKVMLGSTAGFCHGIADWSLERLTEEAGEKPSLLSGVRELAREVDLIGWHPFYQTSPTTPEALNYRADVMAFKAWATRQGFNGECACTEYNWGAGYPAPAEPFWWGKFVCSEVEKAKYVARLTMLHAALGVGSFFCEVWANASYSLDLGLLRRTFSADPIAPLQPQPAYYVMRNLSTALDGLKPEEFSVRFEEDSREIELCTLSRPGEKVIALWRKGKAVDECPGLPMRLVVAGSFQAGSGYDAMNGVEQELRLVHANGETVLEEILLKDYPIILRLKL